MPQKEGKKVYIAGVSKLTWATGEMSEFASALRIVLEYLGEKVPYHFVMGTSGIAFRLVVSPVEWDPGNYKIRNFSTDPDEPIRRAFEAVGYECTVFEKGTKQDDMCRIMASIDKGVPVLAFGVVGPSECCIITGYDEGGEVLLGWSTFQNIPDDHNIPHDPTGYFRKPGWHDNPNTDGYIIIGDKVERRPLRKIYLDALMWAVNLVHTPKVGERYAGLEAYRVWAEEMTQEQYFPEGDKAIIGHRYLSAAINLTMLRDHCSIEPFLQQVAEEESDLALDLAPAIDCYAEMRRLIDSLIDCIDDSFSEESVMRIADADIRREYARILLQIRDKEKEGIGHIERVLEGLD
jgi:hypothetical protein